MDRSIKYALVACILAGPAAGLSYECRYTTECFETDACQETAFDLTLDVSGDFSSATLSTVSGDVETLAYNAQFLSYYTGYADRAMHMVSVLNAGESRYSFQTGAGDSLLSVTYFGSCEAQE